MDPIIIPNVDEAARFKEVRGERPPTAASTPALMPYEPWTAPPVRVHPAGTFAPARCPTCARPAPELVTSPSPSVSTSTLHPSITSPLHRQCPPDTCVEGTSWMISMAAGAAGALLVLALGALVGLLLRWVGWWAAGPLVVLSLMTAVYISSKYPKKANQVLSWARDLIMRAADTLRDRLQEVWGRQVISSLCLQQSSTEI